MEEGPYHLDSPALKKSLSMTEIQKHELFQQWISSERRIRGREWSFDALKFKLKKEKYSYVNSGKIFHL